MTRVLLAAAVSLCSSILANADEPTALPNGIPPIIANAIAIPNASSDHDSWSIKLTVPKVRWEVVGERRPKLEWPEFKVTAESATLTLPMAYSRASQLNEVARNRLLDLKGNRVDRDDALKRLASETAVLISVSGQMPDTYYLQTTRPDTLIVVLGIALAPAPDLLPQPARPTSNKESDEQTNGKCDVATSLPDGTPFRNIKSGIPASHRSWAEPGDEVALRSPQTEEGKLATMLPDGTPFRSTKSGIPQETRSWVEPGDKVVLRPPVPKAEQRQ